MQTPYYIIAKREDLPDILKLKVKVKKHNAAIHLDIWQNEYPQSELILEDILHGNARILKNEQNQIIAFTCLQDTGKEYPESFPEDLMSFSRLMVDCDLQGQGIGTFFINKLIEETKQKNKKGMIITVDSFNQNAIHLYKKFGFEKISTLHIPQAKYMLDVYSLSL